MQWCNAVIPVEILLSYSIVEQNEIKELLTMTLL